MEIKARGPVAATIQAGPLRDFMGGSIFSDDSAPKFPNHIVAIVGWGKDVESNKSFWVVRNSWVSMESCFGSHGDDGVVRNSNTTFYFTGILLG